MTAAEDRGPLVRPAWHELEALAVAMRPDWQPADVEAARIAAEQAWPFDRAAREVWRLIWAQDGTPGELVGTIRAERPRPSAGHLDPDARAGAMARAAAHAGRWLTRQLGKGKEPHGYERRHMPHLVTCTGPRRRGKPKAPAELPSNVIPISRAARKPRGASG